MTAILVVTEHSATVGFGHATRSVTLAAALGRAGADVSVLTFGSPALAAPLLDAAACGRVSLAVDASAADEAARVERIRSKMGPGTRLVVDVVSIAPASLHALRGDAAMVAVLGDPVRGEIPCDLLVHASANEAAGTYLARVPRGSRALLGPRYAVLREDVLDVRRTVPPVAAIVRRILVGLGGGDVCDDSRRVLDALGDVADETSIDVLVPPCAVHERPVAAGDRVRVLDAGDDPLRAMARADVAIVGGGMMAFEAACLGIPALVVVRNVNQQRNADIVTAAGAALALGPADAIKPRALADALAQLAEPSTRAAMRDRGRLLIDGEGTGRVVEEIAR